MLLLSSAVSAAMSRDVIQARQAHVKKDLIDICVALDLDVELPSGGMPCHASVTISEV